MVGKPLVTSFAAEQPTRKTVKGLHSPGLLARWPLIGWVMFIFGSLVFAGLTFNLLNHGPLLAWDNELANILPAIALHSSPFVQGILVAGYYLGEHVIMVLGVLLGIYLLIKKSWRELAMVAVGLAGSTLLFLSLSTFFARERPLTQIWIILDVPGFPSGHAIAVVTFYGLLAYFLTSKMQSAFWKGVVIAAALLVIGFVGFSRIFTGGHYLTDVIAGYAVGIAWSGLVYTLIEIVTQRKPGILRQ